MPPIAYFPWVDAERAILEAAQDCSYPPLKIEVQVIEPTSSRDWSGYLQVSGWVRDAMTLQEVRHAGRKWRLSLHMTRSEVAQTALMACLAWEELEVRERFRYKGRAIFCPHWNVDVLHGLCGQPGSLSERPPVTEEEG